MWCLVWGWDWQFPEGKSWGATGPQAGSRVAPGLACPKVQGSQGSPEGAVGAACHERGQCCGIWEPWQSALGVGAVRAGAAQGQGLWSFGSSHWGHVGTTHWGPKCHGRGAKAMAGQQVGCKVFLHARTWACPTAALPSHGWAVPMLLSISVSSHLP